MNKIIMKQDCGRVAPTSGTACIQTVLGPVPPLLLGHCQAHEHLFVHAGPASQHNPDLLLDSYAASLQELVAYRNAGGAALVDAQPVGSGRMAGLLCRASEESGVHVIASTGFHRPLFYPEEHWISSSPVDRLEALFTHELRDGLFEDGANLWPTCPLPSMTSVNSPPKAGLVKVASGAEGLAESENTRQLFLAAARTAATTGAPVLVHTESGRQGPALVAYFLENGVSASQLILSHLDKVPGNAGDIRTVLGLGAWVCLDTILRPKNVSDEDEIALIHALIDAGYKDRLLLGLDVTRARMRSYGGHVGLADLRLRFIPKLRAQGVPESAITAMTVDNPANALAWFPHEREKEI